MEYQVPQFIEVEDKIFGPLTLKQFIYLAGGGGLVVILVLYLPLFIGILLSIPVAALSLALAFYKMNGKSFVEMLEYGFNYYIGKRLYIWRREKEQVTPTTASVDRGKLEALAWSLDVRTDRDQTIT
jgi:PrgI family protein